MGESGIERLPEGCIAQVISLTSPPDACRCSAVSTAFRSAAASDTVWERFLPDDLECILSRALRPVHSVSKRDLFFFLCNSILIDGGRMSFSLERSSGAKCYMLPASEMYNLWSDNPHYRCWISLPDSRFVGVAELLVCLLEIRRRIQTEMLSLKTTYAAYLVFKLSDGSYGLTKPPQENASKADEEENASKAPQGRDDGRMELELGEFYNEDGGYGEVTKSLMEVKIDTRKKGLIMEGIKIRPKTK